MKCSNEESDDIFLKDLKTFLKTGMNRVPPLIRIAKSINSGLRSLEQAEEVKTKTEREIYKKKQKKKKKKRQMWKIYKYQRWSQ